MMNLSPCHRLLKLCIVARSARQGRETGIKKSSSSIKGWWGMCLLAAVPYQPSNRPYTLAIRGYIVSRGGENYELDDVRAT